MSGINIFGYSSVAVMLLAYSREHRSSAWILIFTLGCIGSSAYGWMAGVAPIGILEGLWAIIAFRKWLRRIEDKTPPRIVHFSERIFEMTVHPAFSRSKRFLSNEEDDRGSIRNEE